MKKSISLLCFLIAFYTHAQKPVEVNKALTKAGKNSIELEKVIQYYQKGKDSLKLQACYFLIKNMEGLTHLDSANLQAFDTIFGVYDSLVTNKVIVHKQETEYPLVYDAWDKIVEKNEDPNTIESSDLETIKADFLIQNIDLAFHVWRTYPWAKHLTFEQFCEYLLPYKISNEPLLPWREKQMKKYAWLPDSLPNKSDAINATRVLYNNLKWFLLNKKLWGYLPLVGSDNLHTAKAGTCYNKTDLNMFVMRAMGLAVTRDFVLYWGNRDSNHYWNAFVMNDGSFLDFEALGAARLLWQGRMPKHAIVNPIVRFGGWSAKMSKVFRETFSQQKETLVEDNKIGRTVQIPYEFEKTRIKDVTSEYTKVADVDFQLSKRVTYPKYIYLCTLNENEWKPAFWARVRTEGSATFKQMGTEIVYMPCRYENWKYIPEGNPILVDSLGNSHELTIKKEVHEKAEFSHDSFATRVIKGETYQLSYFYQYKWIFHSESIAEAKSKITFENVPKNALLRLQKVNGNKNERIFYYADGVQSFY
ncbi:hypothetical protein VB264_17440 [Arcicella aquatica]|uniref:Peptide-N(4)-(N-acetyl-beta-glucosaminyl)asparagine amidase n=1 Tax=Arcicella aquatica TaxID=217141 RepID=A0ABU5QR79_9BACT|nr:hypothetical protein [Arcicella aquatica]MEA5259586.1 hypothetical protein [Arcicella aquatica]